MAMDVILVSLMVLLSSVSGTPVILRLDSCSESETVITCIVSEGTLRWDIDFLSSSNIIQKVEYLPDDPIGTLLHATIHETVYNFNLTSRSPLTSTMTTIKSTDLYGATVTCRSGFDTVSAPNAMLVVGVVQVPSSPYNFTVITTFQLETPNTTFMDVYLHWNVTDDNEDMFYIVTVIPESVTSNLTSLQIVTSNTSTRLDLLYGQEYNISVAASNCAGTSAPAEIYIEWHSQCPILPWANIGPNISLEFSSGTQIPRLIYQCQPGLETREITMVSMCTSNSKWNPDPADIACICEDKECVITISNGQDDHGIIALSTTFIVLFLFLVVLSLTTALFVTVWLHRRKQDSRSETQTVEQAQNDYTEVEHLQQYQDEDLDYAHVELSHNLTEGHSTFTLISELQNPLYQNIADDHDPDESLNLDSLLIQLRAHVTPKWRQFGIAIGIPEDLLQQYSSCPIDERLMEIFDYWLKNSQNPTWRDVAKILCDIELRELAEGILSIYETGKLPIEVDADDSDSDDNILLPLPIPSNMLSTTEVD